MLTQLRLENFKSWKDTGDIPLRPITGFFGANSSGKSSLFQALLLMKQTVDSPDRGILFHFGDRNTPVSLGDFEAVVHNHDLGNNLGFTVGWNAKRKVRLPKVVGGETTPVSAEILFRVQTREESVAFGKSLMLQEMAYRVANQWFGIKRLQNEDIYEPFPLYDKYVSSRQRDSERRVDRPFKFHRFPYWADEYFQDDDFPFDLEYGLELFLDEVYYLGPLRAQPNRTYAWSGAQPPDMGQAGELVVDALLASRRSRNVETGPVGCSVTVEQYIARWLQRLGLVHDFRVEAVAEGRRLYEVKVRKTPNSAEVLLTDVGFGVSQILPVLVLCFYVPPGSVVILDQPDIHLHPSVQAGLADVFIDAWEKRGVQILFESHSEHLIRRLQRRIAEQKMQRDDVGLYFCTSEDDGSSSLSHLAVDEFGNISNWPKDFFGDQFGEIAAMNEAALSRQGDPE